MQESTKKGLIEMKNMKAAMKIREKNIKKLMKEANWGREEAEKWINYIESVSRKKLKEMINS
jgi:hypothetical protein